MSELECCFLYAQLLKTEKVNQKRINLWNAYFKALTQIDNAFEIPFIPSNCNHNGHIFYIKCKNRTERDQLINHLKLNEINTSFHYVPLHSAEAGKKFGSFNGEDRYTTTCSERLIRLPLYYDLKEVEKVVSCLSKFYQFA